MCHPSLQECPGLWVTPVSTLQLWASVLQETAVHSVSCRGAEHKAGLPTPAKTSIGAAEEATEGMARLHKWLPPWDAPHT